MSEERGRFARMVLFSTDLSSEVIVYVYLFLG
jgi:hypothetical protein